MFGIQYKFRDGWHTFTSKQMPGLYVASHSLITSLLDVLPSIRMLRRLDGQ